MFNFDFSELMVIGIVALVVIGPERLPKVARAAGYWMGRFQRFMNTLAEDINKEMEIDRLKEIQRQAETEIMKIDKRIQEESAETETIFAEAQYKINAMSEKDAAWSNDASGSDGLAESEPQTTEVVEQTAPEAKEPVPAARESSSSVGTVVADADKSEAVRGETSSPS